MIQGTHALIVSNDTVYESSFLGRNDSTSLVNNSSDTVRLDYAIFIPPTGKEADLEFGYDLPYSKNGLVFGHVAKGNQRLYFSSPENIIPPKTKKIITGFVMEICIGCPTGNSGSSSSKMGTLKTLLLFSGSSGDRVGDFWPFCNSRVTV